MHAKISSNERRLGTRQGGGEKSPEHSRARRASDLAWSSETRRARVSSPFFSAQWFQPDGYNSTSKMILKFLSYHACVSGFLDLHELFCNMIGVTDTGAQRSGWQAPSGGSARGSWLGRAGNTCLPYSGGHTRTPNEERKARARLVRAFSAQSMKAT